MAFNLTPSNHLLKSSNHQLQLSTMFATVKSTLLNALALGAILSGMAGVNAVTCNELPNSTNSLSNFALSVWNLTLPNANNTGAPLVLAEKAAITGIQFWSLTAYASYPMNDYPIFNLANGELVAVGSGPAAGTEGFAGEVTPGSWISFAVTKGSLPSPGPATDFCAVGSTSSEGSPNSQYYRLNILNAEASPQSWAICPDGTHPGQQTLYFNPQAGASGGPSGCYAVDVLILPL
ncbi:hypothetical protein ABKN59_007596 [Abortiporus biennis]